MNKTIPIALTGIFLCVIGIFLEKDYIVASFLTKIVTIEKEQEFFDKTIGNHITIIDKKIIRGGKPIQKLGEIILKLSPSLPPSKYVYKTFIRDAPEINAYTYPGGYIVITTGLIKSAESFEEFLAILAHEIAHVNQRHPLKSMFSQAGMSMLFDFITGDINGLIDFFLDKSGDLLYYKFSRNQEQEADILAIDYLNRAKVDSGGFINFLSKIKKEDSAFFNFVNSTNFELFSTHPLTKNRLEYTQDYIKKNNIPRFAPVELDDGFNYQQFKELFN